MALASISRFASSPNPSPQRTVLLRQSGGRPGLVTSFADWEFGTGIGGIKRVVTDGTLSIGLGLTGALMRCLSIKVFLFSPR
jgi:hypothetical protein